MTKQILNNIKYKANEAPTMIEAADRIFIIDHARKYSVIGHACKKNGDYLSELKFADIQKTKSGKRFIMADGVRFDADAIKPCVIAREIVEKELALSISMRETILDIQRQGDDIGYSLENQDYYIQNLKNYLEGEVSEAR
jgi:hypothetical protein